MTRPENKLLRYAMVPWIVAIIALVGWNSVAPGHRAPRKNELTQDSGISELSADDLQVRGRSSEPLVFVAPPSADEPMPPGLVSLFSQVESPPDQPTSGRENGAVRGRAPPSLRSA